MKPGSRASPHYGQTRRRRLSTPTSHPPLPVSDWQMPEVHPSNCLCPQCLTAGQHRADFDKQKALQELL